MRDYLYFWHDSHRRFVVASGIEIRDLARPSDVSGGLLLLAHKHFDAAFDFPSRFSYVPQNELELLQEADPYSWGDVCWTDYAGETFPKLTPQEIAELLYFRHTGQPLGHVTFPNLKNRFLFSGHDDGWFLKIYYDSWADVVGLLRPLPLLQNLAIQERLLDGRSGSFWIDRSGLTEEEPTMDIDSILNRRITEAQQAGAGQPATRPVVEPVGCYKPQPEAEGRCP